MAGKQVYYLDGTAACFKSTILSTLYQNNICFTSSSDLTHLRNTFPALYTRDDGIQYNTIGWYSMYQTELFLNGKIGEEYNTMCCDRSPIASFVYGLINKKGEKISPHELKKILPAWICDYLKTTKTLFLVDTDINAVEQRLKKRNGFDVNFATEEYFILQNIYFMAIAEACDLQYFDINGKTFSDVYNYVENWVGGACAQASRSNRRGG